MFVLGIFRFAFPSEMVYKAPIAGYSLGSSRVNSSSWELRARRNALTCLLYVTSFIVHARLDWQLIKGNHNQQFLVN